MSLEKVQPPVVQDTEILQLCYHYCQTQMCMHAKFQVSTCKGLSVVHEDILAEIFTLH